MASAQPALARNAPLAAHRFGLARMFPQCQTEDCPERGNFWPPFRRRSGGIYIGDRWVCGSPCLQRSLLPVFRDLIFGLRHWTPTPRRIPLGLLLLSRGVIQEEQLRKALELQRSAARERLGFWLQQIQAATEADITAALAMQWAAPVFPLERDRSFRECASLVPLPLLEALRVLPVYFARPQRLLYVGFVEGVNHSILSVVESILDCRTLPCMIPAAAFERALAEIRSLPKSEYFFFESVSDPFEMAHITSGFAHQVRAKRVDVSPCDRFAWVRFHSAARSHSTDTTRDLVFQLPVAK